jgi:hypothetical protein
MMQKKIKGYISIYSKETRDSIVSIANKFLSQYGIPIVSDNLFLCVDELAKNAVQANYKFLLFTENLYNRIQKANPEKSDDAIMQEINDIIKIQKSLDYFAEKIFASEKIANQVRNILNDEAKLLNIKNKAYNEKRYLTDEEKKRIQSLVKLNTIRNKIKDNKLKIMLIIESDDKFLYIEVTNTAPILTKDIDRIYWIQDEFRKLVDQGREYEFFVNNLDTSESGFGLGYATINSVLMNWGLDPAQAITIITSTNTTIRLTIPIDVLKVFL